MNHLTSGRKQIDVSVVLNVHRESTYLQRTLRSICDALNYARHHGIRSELVVVLDRSDALTENAVRSFPFFPNDPPIVAKVDYGCLGSSRNAGIKLASGDFIATADGDDLISYNYFEAMHRTAKTAGQQTALFPQYYFGFGDNYHLCEYYGTEAIPKTLLFSVHPYVSRVFSSAASFKEDGYVKTPANGPFAYEDWHFNCELLARGYEFMTVAHVAVYYRQRPGSMLRNANATSLRCIPPSRFFHPDVFVALKEDERRTMTHATETRKGNEIKNHFESELTNIELLHAANSIEPAVQYIPHKLEKWFNYAARPLEPSDAYYNVCKKLASQQFTDIFLVPFLVIGGADKYVIEVMKGITAIDPMRKILVLSMQSCMTTTWLDELPDSVNFIDVFAECANLGQEVVNLIVFRVIQACGPNANLYLKSAESTLNFFSAYRTGLGDNPTTYFRFMDNRYNYRGMSWRSGFDFDFLSNCGENLKCIVTDNKAVVQLDKQSLGHLADKMHVLYAYCKAPGRRTDSPSPAKRLLWASRLDFQKRPDRLIAIATALAEKNSGVTIDVYGSTVLQSFDADRFQEVSNLRFCGPYSDFDSLETDGYFGFLYTTDYDGLPNVILEAMGKGLPVIAPNVGGIAEIVDQDNGFLVAAGASEESLIAGYVAAIEGLVCLGHKLGDLRAAAIERIREQHSMPKYLERLNEVFDLRSSKHADRVPDVT